MRSVSLHDYSGFSLHFLQCLMSYFISDFHDETLRILVEALTESGQAVSIFDADDNLRYANKTYHGMFLGDFDGPFTFTDITRHAHKNGLGVRIDDNDVEAFIARTLPRRRSIPRKSFETDLVDGRWFWIDHTVLPNGWVLSVGADITALKQNEKSLRQAHEVALQASRTDLLTDLPNRRYILELLDEALATNKATGSSLCITIIDIDKFKAINDAHGHEAGDAVLQQFARVCRERLGRHDQIGRMGGEEFLLILPNTSLIDAARAVEKIRRGCAEIEAQKNAPTLSYTFSAGLAETLSDDNVASALRRADRALYTAKREGRDRTKVGFETEALGAWKPNNVGTRED